MGESNKLVFFELADGQELSLPWQEGDTLMDVALDHNVPGILAQCGGGCTCCTCHCWVQGHWVEKLPPSHQDEIDMLEFAWGKRRGSRLACQIKLQPELAGLKVKVPPQQALNDN